ncbi:MAG TPA: CBS domain-containing protein [Planctomycetaceae bacterium]|nr:CBS domain-containing protein [Planctomycetaceae bacterium]
MSETSIVRVRDVMSEQFDLVDGMLTVKDALLAMRYPDAKALIINKRNDDDEFGIVLIADIAKQVLAADRSPERVNLYEIMAKPVLSVAPDMNIRYCARMMQRFGLSLAPVIENGKVLGLVSYHDLVVRGMLSVIKLT